MSTLSTGWTPIYTPELSDDPGTDSAHFIPLTAPQRLMDWAFAAAWTFEFINKSTGNPSDDLIQVALGMQYSIDGAVWSDVTVGSDWETEEGTYTGVNEVIFPEEGGPPSLLVRFGLAVANKTSDATKVFAYARLSLDGFIKA